MTFGSVDATELVVKPNLPVLGPKLGAGLGELRRALEAGDFEKLAGGGVPRRRTRALADEVLVERRGKEGWALASSDGLTVALDTHLDDDLVLLGRVLDLVHRREHDAQGRRPRAHRSHPSHRCRPPTPTCSPTSSGSPRRRSPCPSRPAARRSAIAKTS